MCHKDLTLINHRTQKRITFSGKSGLIMHKGGSYMY